MAVLAGLIGFFGGLLSRGLPVTGARHGGGWGGHSGGAWGDRGGFGGVATGLVAARVKVVVAHFMQPIAVYRDSTGFLRPPHRAQG